VCGSDDSGVGAKGATGMGVSVGSLGLGMTPGNDDDVKQIHMSLSYWRLYLIGGVVVVGGGGYRAEL
jgi:hypothetical protein